MSSRDHPSRYRLAALDGLRCVAVLLVMIFHADKPALIGGWVGVDVFFVLSGYLITQTLLQTEQERGSINLADFYWRRFLRLSPAFAGLVLAALVYLICTSAIRSENAIALAFAATYTMDLAAAFTWNNGGDYLHTWSLAVEQQFYLLWPLALILVPRRFLVRFTLTCITLILFWRLGLAATGSSASRLYFGFDTRVDSILVGCLLALVPVGAGVRDWARRTVWVPLVLLLAFALRVGAHSLIAVTIGLSLAAGLSVWLILAAGESGRFSRFLGYGPIAYLGRISYGVYLWHLPIVIVGRRHLPAFEGRDFLLVAVAVPIASLSFHLLERPILQAARRSGKARTVLAARIG